ncbi:MAG: sensor histidine kinase [Thermoplasmatota archaeon]
MPGPTRPLHPQAPIGEPEAALLATVRAWPEPSLLVPRDGSCILEASEAFLAWAKLDRAAVLGRAPMDVVLADADGASRVALAARASIATTALAAPWDAFAVAKVTPRRDASPHEELLRTVAHELRTPLTPLRLQAEFLETERLGPLNERQLRSVGILHRNLDRISHLVEQALEAARLQSGRLPVTTTPADIVFLAQEVVETYEDPAAANGITLIMDPGTRPGGPLVAYVDRARTMQVLHNLISNALRFTPPGGRVIVSFEREEPATVWVRVRDTGQGFEPQDAGRLFRPFSQLPAMPNQPPSGSGLGLYICKGMIEQQGGVCIAASEGRGKGATFSFSLKLASAESPGPQTSAVPLSAASNVENARTAG